MSETDSQCIFCGQEAIGSSRSHVLPESLGGADWACLPDGTVCSGCNQYFGKEVESRALASHPLLPMRVFLGIPTKKNRPPHFSSIQGTVIAARVPGALGIEPRTTGVEEGIMNRRITQMRILAQVSEPKAMCRWLLKMGLETVALTSRSEAREKQYNTIRQIARAPQPKMNWWFLVHIDYPALTNKIINGVHAPDYQECVYLETLDVESIEVFHVKLFDIEFFTPLHEGMLPDETMTWPHPEWELCKVSF